NGLAPGAHRDVRPRKLELVGTIGGVGERLRAVGGGAGAASVVVGGERQREVALNGRIVWRDGGGQPQQRHCPIEHGRPIGSAQRLRERPPIQLGGAKVEQ